MSRITTITFMLAVLGMATPSVLCNLPETSESLPAWKRKGSKSDRTRPPVISTHDHDPLPILNSRCQSTNLYKGMGCARNWSWSPP